MLIVSFKSTYFSINLNHEHDMVKIFLTNQNRTFTILACQKGVHNTISKTKGIENQRRESTNCTVNKYKILNLINIHIVNK